MHISPSLQITGVMVSGSAVRAAFEPLILHKTSEWDFACQILKAHIGCMRKVAPLTISTFPGGGENSKLSMSSMSIACISISLIMANHKNHNTKKKEKDIREAPSEMSKARSLA
jgi:hypothetical protein